MKGGGKIMKREYKKGFTLIELLVVIAIIVILAAALFLVINPVELLQRSRDSRRVSEVGEVNKALAAAIANTQITTWPAARTARNSCAVAPAVPATGVDGSGWLGGFVGTMSSFIPRLPTDPTNTGTQCYFGTLEAAGTAQTWEISVNLELPANATLESTDGGDDPALYEVGTDVGLDLI